MKVATVALMCLTISGLGPMLIMNALLGLAAQYGAFVYVAFAAGLALAALAFLRTQHI